MTERGLISHWGTLVRRIGKRYNGISRSQSLILFYSAVNTNGQRWQCDREAFSFPNLFFLFSSLCARLPLIIWDEQKKRTWLLPGSSRCYRLPLLAAEDDLPVRASGRQRAPPVLERAEKPPPLAPSSGHYGCLRGHSNRVLLIKHWRRLIVLVNKRANRFIRTRVKRSLLL